MIVFKKIRYKNFLSTGNCFTEISLNSNKSTLVVGQNGSGKSTMLDALSFALFGKAHRNINKPQLVNSINQRDMLVQIEFSIGSSEYRINRGVKPTVFEIYRDDVLINQDSHNKDYQKVLEQNILKLNHKSFHQIVVLGSSSFVPFMQLPAQHRREVIEDLLDINVFSKMNQVLREQVSILKDKSAVNSHSLEIVTTKIDAQKKYIRDVTKLNVEYLEEKKNQVQQLSDEIYQLTSENNVLIEENDAKENDINNEIMSFTGKLSLLRSYEADFKSKMKTIVKEAKFYEDNEICPTCEQDISANLKTEKLCHTKNKAKEIQSGIKKVETEIKNAESSLKSAEEKMKEVRNIQSQINSNNQTIQRLQMNINQIQAEIVKMSAPSDDMTQANAELEELQNSKDTLLQEKYELNEQSSYHQVIGELLKDTGIKTKIIKQYIPVINKLSNDYLQILDFYVSFHLDDTFKETIKSRHRDVFTYESFSEGEKQRIDLALLFTWRMIAKMKNSVATNLLILDETFDSSLDADGVENLTKILETLDDKTNVFVISHKGELLDGRFDTKIEFAKVKNFSKIAA